MTEKPSLITINLARPPKWLWRLLLVVALIAASGAGCYLWGMRSDTAFGDRLSSEPLEMRRGRYAGYAVSLVGNQTISENWVAFCNSVVEDCANILEEREQGR
jgi:hypothetical protein